MYFCFLSFILGNWKLKHLNWKPYHLYMPKRKKKKEKKLIWVIVSYLCYMSHNWCSNLFYSQNDFQVFKYSNYKTTITTNADSLFVIQITCNARIFQLNDDNDITFGLYWYRHIGLQQSEDLLLCVLCVQDPHRNDLWRKHSLPFPCLCGKLNPSELNSNYDNWDGT